MNIFEKLNILLTESEGETKVKESDIPIHPEMETKEQGVMAAAEKILKLFQKLKANSGGGTETVKDEKPEIPDDIIDPMMKEAPKSSKDKTFEKNKLAGWDEKSEEKIIHFFSFLKVMATKRRLRYIFSSFSFQKGLSNMNISLSCRLPAT